MVPAIRLDDFLPLWTDRTPVNAGGRDPLGLSRVANRIMDETLPGIVTTTNRARYYSLYCWILWNITREDKPRSMRAFQQAFMRREAPIAMASVLAGDGDSPVGVEAARERIEKARKSTIVQTAFRVLPSHALGGYGQYYQGPLYRLGLTTADDLGIPCVAPGRAERLAEAAHYAIERTPWWRKGRFRESEMPFRELEASAPALSLTALANPSTGHERRQLIELFFGSPRELPTVETQIRRQSLALLLELVQQHEGASAPLDSADPARQVLRGAHYAKRLLDREGRDRGKLTRIDKLPPTFNLWRLFMAHEYLVMAIEGLFWALLEIASERPDGVSLKQIIARLTRPTFYSTMRALVGTSASSPGLLMAALDIHAVPSSADCLAARNARCSRVECSEEALVETEPDTPERHAASCCVLLAVLYRKWRQGREVDLREFARGAANDLWIETVLPALDDWLDPGAKWSNVLERFFRTYILDVHQRVLFDKHRLESRWFEWAEDRIVRTQELVPYMRGSRINAAMHILRDVQLVRISGGEVLSLTTEGRRILASALEGDR